MMNRFIKKTILFFLPFLLLFVLVGFIDPFQFFFPKTQFAGVQKANISFHLNYPLWKYIEYRHAPAKHILLGDSRMESLSNAQMKRITGIDYYNMAFGGGTVAETVESFWFAVGQSQLESVTIGLNFGRYNSYDSENRCIEAKDILANPYLYFINQSVLKSAFYILKDGISGSQTQISKPLMDRESFWKHQLSFLAKTFYRDYAYPAHYYEQLTEIAQYCHDQGIKLRFVILPTHVELQDKIIEYDRTEEYARFKKDLESLGRVWDFHQKDELTRDQSLYKDPFHFKEAIGDIVIKRVFVE